jgi:2-dehydro-3-deoxyphosphogluconate aldolase / (4S)-4-hydroxy-2-oxoglutarate aldolase
MKQSSFSFPLFAQAPIVGIIRNLPLADVLDILPVYQAAGLTTIEITMNTPDAASIIRRSLDQHPDGLNIGAGTVCTMADLETALAAGAQFIVTPIVVDAVILACLERGIPIFAGAFTPSEIYKAWSLGASIVKVFPCTALGPAYISDLKAPLDQLKLLPTGGVSLTNMAAFFRAGAEGVGIGSHLFDKALIRAKNWPMLQTHFQAFTDCFMALSQTAHTTAK